MKKIILGFVLLSIVIVLTGCNATKKITDAITKETKLVCRQTTSGVDITFNVGFSGNVVSNMDLIYDMDVSKYDSAQIEAFKAYDFCSTVKSAMSTYSDAFTNCKQNIANGNLRITADFDVAKLTGNSRNTVSTPEAAKESLEKTGYTCTVE